MDKLVSSKIFVNLFLILIIPLTSINCNRDKVTKTNPNEIDTSIVITNKPLRDSIFFSFLQTNNVDNKLSATIHSNDDMFRMKNFDRTIDTFIAGIKGLRQIKETSYNYNFGKKQNEGNIEFIKDYSINGKLKHVFFTSEKEFAFTSLDYKITDFFYFYDSLNYLTKIECRNYYGATLCIVKYEYENCKIVNKQYINTEFNNGKQKQNKGYRSVLHDMNWFILIHNGENISYRYNNLSLLEEEIKWFKTGSPELKKIFKYDNSGNIIGCEIYEWNWKKNNITKKLSYFFYTNSIKEIIFNMEENIERTYLYFLNDNYNLIEKRRISGNNNLDWKITYNFDSNTKLIEEGLYKWDLSIDRNVVYRYDNNNLIEETIYDSKNEIISNLTSTYNSENKKISEVKVNNKNDNEYRHTYKYDKDLLIEKTIYDKLNEPVKTYTYEYQFYE